MKKYSEIKKRKRFYILGEWIPREGEPIENVVYEYAKGTEHCLRVYLYNGTFFDPGDEAPLSNFSDILRDDPELPTSLTEAWGRKNKRKEK